MLTRCGFCGAVHSHLYLVRAECLHLNDILQKEKALHEEVYNSYYRLSADSHVCEQILNEFGVDPVHGHIIKWSRSCSSKRW